jgi:glyoxylase-like metal-dependent hydrolase (beta-lactamase superfamily II)
MKPLARLILAVAVVALLHPALRAQNARGNDQTAWSADIAELRRVATLIPGPLARRINVVKFAESRRTKNFSIKGAPTTPSVQARTAFQVRYADSTLMIDAGMDQQVHNFFGRGVVEPYDSEAGKQVERAVADARLIVLTHEHGDHIGGVIHSPRAAQLAAKTILTRTQMQTLMTSPQMPEIKLSPELASRFIVVDYDRYLPIAPGIAIVKAAGHTPGSQMVYVMLETGREYLFIGDSAWHMDGVRQMIGKDAPWVTEDQASVMDQLRWLNGLSRTDPRLVIVASHDDEQRMDLEEQGLLGSAFD